MNEKLWYAVLVDEYDSDWGTGSEDLETAKEMVREFGGDAYIAIIADGPNPVCIGTIKEEDNEVH